jgi:hypothetical protein
MIFGIIIFYLVFIVFFVAAFWRIFTKAGKPGWACLIPIYNLFVLADIAQVERKNAWLFMILYVVGAMINLAGIRNPFGLDDAVFSIISLVFSIAALVYLFKIWKGLALSFGKTESFAWGLLFLNVIFVPILAFGSATYQNEGAYTNQDVLDSDF